MDKLYICTCGFWWISAPADNYFHHAYYTDLNGVSFAPMHCDTPMVEITRQDRLSIVSSPIDAPTIIDSSDASTTADTIQMPAITAPVTPSLPADTAHTAHTTPAKRYGLFSLPSRIPVKEVA